MKKTYPVSYTHLLCVPPYTLTLQDGVVVKIEEKFYN